MIVVNSKSFNKNVELDVHVKDGSEKMCVSFSCQTDLYTHEYCVISETASRRT